MTLKITSLDSYVGLAFSIIAAVLVTLNVTTFGFEQPWKDLILYGGPVLVAFGISPITSAKLDTLLHLSAKEVTGLAALDAAAIAAVQTFGWPTNTTGIVTGVLTLIGGVLFGTAALTPAPAPASTVRR